MLKTRKNKKRNRNKKRRNGGNRYFLTQSGVRKPESSSSKPKSSGLKNYFDKIKNFFRRTSKLPPPLLPVSDEKQQQPNRYGTKEPDQVHYQPTQQELTEQQYVKQCENKIGDNYWMYSDDPEYFTKKCKEEYFNTRNKKKTAGKKTKNKKTKKH
jgi:hypothetical protein